MIGIYATTQRALALGSALANRGEEVLLVGTDEEELEELREGHLGLSDKKLKEAFEKAEESKKLSYSGNVGALLKADIIFVSGRIVRGETDPAVSMRFIIQNVLTLLRRAANDRIPAQNVNIALIDPLPFRGYEALTERLINEEIQIGEDYSEEGDGLSDSEISHKAAVTELNPDGLAFNLALCPILAPEGELGKWCQGPRNFIIGSFDESLIGRLKEIAKELGTHRKNVLVSTPQGVDDALILSDAYRLMRQSFVNEAQKLTDADLFIELIKNQAIPKPTFQIDNELTERLEGLTELKKELTLFSSTLVQALESQQEKSRSIVSELVKYCRGSIKDVPVAIVGIAQKPGSGDMRGAQFLELASSLVSKGAQLKLYMPEGTHDLKWRLREYKDSITYAKNFSEAVRGTKILLILGKPGFSLDLKRTARLMGDDPILFDPYGYLSERKGLALFTLLS